MPRQKTKPRVAETDALTLARSTTTLSASSRGGHLQSSLREADPNADDSAAKAKVLKDLVERHAERATSLARAAAG